MKKRAIILGSTGSVGRGAYEVLSRLEDEWSIVGLAAASQGSLLAEQALRCRAKAAAVVDDQQAGLLANSLNGSAGVFAGDEALLELVESVEADCLVSAVVGTGGLAATLKAVERGWRIALANKEAMVIAGSLLMKLAEQSGSAVIPIDSEHSAIFQAMHAGRRADVHKVYLTASGGPFRTWREEDMEAVTVADALQHPTWNMGPKITIDSATMMNKALEIVEACRLFHLDPDQIEVVVHPESILHSMVEFCDGSLIAQLGPPDMRTPIQYALTYPVRQPCPSQRLDWAAVRQLNFHPPDLDRFPSLRLGYDVARQGGTAGAVLNAANESAVELFREGAIRFGDVVRLTVQTLAQHEHNPSPTLDDLLKADRWARDEVTRCMTC